MMTFSKKLCGMAGAAGLSLFAALPAWAQEAAEAAPAAAVPNPGNNAWMMTSTVLVPSFRGANGSWSVSPPTARPPPSPTK